MANVINTNSNVCRISLIKEKDFSIEGKTVYTLSKSYNSISENGEVFTLKEDKSESVTTDVFCEQPDFITDGIYYPLGSDLYGYTIADIKNTYNERLRDSVENVIKPPKMYDSDIYLEGIPFTFEGVTPCNRYSCNLLRFPSNETSWESCWHTVDGSKIGITSCDNVYNAVDCLSLNKIPQNTYFEYVYENMPAGDYTVSCNMRVFDDTTSGNMVLMVLPDGYEYKGEGTDNGHSVIGHIPMNNIIDDWKTFYYSFNIKEVGTYKIIVATNCCNINNTNNNYENFNLKVCGMMLTKTTYPMIYNAYEQNYDGKSESYEPSDIISEGETISAVFGENNTLAYDSQEIILNTWKKKPGYPAVFDIFGNGVVDYTKGFTITYKRRFPCTNTTAYDYLGEYHIDSKKKYDSTVNDYYSFVTERVVLVVNPDFTTMQYSSLTNSSSGSISNLAKNTYLYLGYNPTKNEYSNNATYSDLIVYNRVLTEEEIKNIFNKVLSFAVVDTKLLLKHTNIMETKNKGDKTWLT